MNNFTKRLVFDDIKHKYTVGGKEIPSVTEIVEPLTFRKYSVDSAVLQQAKIKGAAVHEACTDYDFGAITNESQLSPDVVMYLSAWKDFCRDYKPEWLLIEQRMACNDFAGTVDRVGVIDGNPCIVDIKTTSSMDRASKVTLCAQIAGYILLCDSNTDYKIQPKNCMGVQLTKDGKYSVIPVKRTEEKYDFSSLSLFCKMIELNKLVRGDRSIVTE